MSPFRFRIGFIFHTAMLYLTNIDNKHHSTDMMSSLVNIGCVLVNVEIIVECGAKVFKAACHLDILIVDES